MRLITRTLMYAVLACPVVGFSQRAQAEETAVNLTKLEVQSPVVSDVYIDNTLVGKTPLTVEVSIGSHFIRVVADGYDPYVRKVTANGNTLNQFSADLTEGGGTVEFQNALPQAVLLLDSEEYMLPIRLNPNLGTHQWKMVAEGYETITGTFNLQEGQNIFVYKEMESSAGKALFETNPAGATIWLNGDLIGATPMTMDDLPAGEYSVVLKHHKYGTVYRTMDTTQGNKGIVKAKLSKRGAKVKIKTKIKDAHIYVEDALVGVGKKAKLGNVAAGDYNIRITSNTHQAFQGTMHIPASGKANFVATLIPKNEEGIPKLIDTATNSVEVNWALWGSVLGGSVLTASGTYFVLQMIEPEPAPSGDVVVKIP